MAASIYEWLFIQGAAGPGSGPSVTEVEQDYRYRESIESLSVDVEFIVLAHERRMLIVRFDDRLKS